MADTYENQSNGALESNNTIEQAEFINVPGTSRLLAITRNPCRFLPRKKLPKSDSTTALRERSAETAPCLVTETETVIIIESKKFRVDGFANKKSLSGWFPQINKDEKTSLRIRFSKRNQALLLQVALIATVLVTNLFILAYATSKYPSKNGVGLLFAGDCDTVKTANRLLHLLINVLSTGMLSASSYCIQLQASPTRQDVDKAHRSNRWVDIGAPSLRNLRYIGPWRVASCVVLCLSSLPVHLIFNSAVFQSLASNDYNVAVVKESFITGGSWDTTMAIRNRQHDPGWDQRDTIITDLDLDSVIEGIQKDVIGGLYERKNISDCYALYEDYWSAQQGNVVVVVKDENLTKGDNDTLLLHTLVVPRFDNYAKNSWAASNGSSEQIAFSSVPPPITTLYLGPPHYEASFCLVQYVKASTDRCRLQYSTHILTAVCVLNFVKLLTMLFVYISRSRTEGRRKARREKWGTDDHTEEDVLARKEAVLSTLGDAISSFMQDPDETTQDMCLATKHDFLSKKKHFWRTEKEPENLYTHPRQWKMSDNRWMTAATWGQWTTLVVLYLAFLIGLYTSLGLLTASLKNRHFHLTLSFFRSLGFGAVSELTYLNIRLPRGDPVGLILNVLIINSPQLLFSIMYSAAGAVLTTLLVQREFSRMYTRRHRKPLRVSEPVGIQRSSYFISLPLRYGIPQNVFSAAFHWLISQSYFLARITALMPDGLEDYGNSFSTLGYSPYAIIVTGIIGFIHILTIVLIGCRKYDGTMSMVSTNSMAISAACHSLPEDREYGHQLPVQWGVVEIGDDGIGHCAFTTAPCDVIRKAQEDILYQ